MLEILLILVLDQKNNSILANLKNIQWYRVRNVPDGRNLMHILVIVHFNFAVIIPQNYELFVVILVVNVLHECWDTEVRVKIQRVLWSCLINIAELVCDDNFALSINCNTLNFLWEVGFEDGWSWWCESTINVVVLDGFAWYECKLVVSLSIIFSLGIKKKG